ncbi:MAG: PRC-barrel domain containing protein [Planctomycetes bacterium]|nr:PRC-barrel domain containing protein [Planctomycetota bacterium]
MSGRRRMVFLGAGVAAMLLSALTAQGQMDGSQQRQREGSQDPWSAQSQYNQKFNADQCERIEGTVQGVGTFQPAPGAETGVLLQVRTQDGRTQTVHLGPQRYVQQQGMRFSEGDRIVLAGAPAQFEGREVIMASTVQMDDKTLQLRDMQGRPRWTGAMQGRQQDMAGRAGQAQTGQFQPQLLDADTLVGQEVKGRNNETLGRIDDLVLNADRDKVEYAAVTSGGLLGLGTKYVAVPWDELAIRHTDRDEIQSVTVDVTKDQWDRIKGFDSGRWPARADPNWRHPGAADGEADRERGGAPARESLPGTTQGEYRPPREDRTEGADRQQRQALGVLEDDDYRRVTQIDGMPVRNPQQENLGTIEDIVLDLREGRPVLSVVQFGGVLGLGLQYATVPWPALEIVPDLKIARIDATQESLDAIAYVAGNEPDLTQMGEVESLYRRFNEQPYWQTYGYVQGASTGGQIDHAWSAEGPYQRNFNPRQITTLQGTVLSIGAFRPAPGAPLGQNLTVRTEEGETIVVHVGPQEYVQQQGIDFNTGDRIGITGSRTLFEGDEIIMATEIQTSDRTLQLRGRDGLPLWGSRGQMQREQREMQREQRYP